MRHEIDSLNISLTVNVYYQHTSRSMPHHCVRPRGARWWAKGVSRALHHPDELKTQQRSMLRLHTVPEFPKGTTPLLVQYPLWLNVLFQLLPRFTADLKHEAHLMCIVYNCAD